MSGELSEFELQKMTCFPLGYEEDEESECLWNNSQDTALSRFPLQFLSCPLLTRSSALNPLQSLVDAILAGKRLR